MTERVGLLTTRDHPLLPSILNAFEGTGIVPFLLFDEKGLSPREHRLFAERTAGAFAAPVPADVARHSSADTADHNAAETIALVRREGLTLLANAGTPRRIGPALLGAVTGVVNAHPGLLPKYRGASCCEWAIWNDDPVGVTAHFLDDGLDSGPIIFSRELEVPRGAVYTDVRIALYRLQIATLVGAVVNVAREGLVPGALPPQPPGEALGPIPDELLAQVEQKLRSGRYAHAR